MRRAIHCQPPATSVERKTLLRVLLVARAQQKLLSVQRAHRQGKVLRRSRVQPDRSSVSMRLFVMHLLKFFSQFRVSFLRSHQAPAFPTTASLSTAGTSAGASLRQKQPFLYRALFSLCKWVLAQGHAVSLLLAIRRWRYKKARPAVAGRAPTTTPRPLYPALTFLNSPAAFLGRSLWNITYPFIYTAKTYALQSLIILSASSVILSSTYVLHEAVFKDLPSATMLTNTEPNVSTKILDRNGTVLFRLFADENRTIVALSDIPRHVVFATIAIEDKDFYDHHGFSITGITRALFSNMRHESIQGGSTITQQLVKNRLLSPERTVTRKLRELLLAVAVENAYDKNQILEMYLNQVAYGGATYGIEEAAQKYFGKPVQELSLAEAALLAGLPQAPSVYSPFGSNPELAFARQNEVLRRMTEDGYITAQQAAAAKSEELRFRDDVIDIKAPHFVMYIKKLLAAKYGEELLYQGGLEVRTSLDLPLQEEAQKIVRDEVVALTRLRVNNGAALITNPKTGEILSMVGSKDYFDFDHDGQVNVTIRPRQPGSSIKPLTYAIALEKGFSPGTAVADAPVTYTIPGSPPYSPKNYDGRFHGTVTLREALASSYNIPAVKTLAHISVDALIDKGQLMGVSTWQNRKRFGLSLTLGGGEVLMTEMAQVYGSFANNGVTMPLDPILEIKTYKGETLYRNTCALDGVRCVGYETLEPRVAYMISSILSDNAARTPAFGPFSTLNIPNQEVAVKTGTTNNLRDNWTFGYTDDRLVAVWVGNNDNTPMSYVVSGVTGASSIWNKLMRSQLSEEKPHQFAQPSGLVELPLCLSSSTRTLGARNTQTQPTASPTPRISISSRPELYLAERVSAGNCIPAQFSRIPETPSNELNKMIGGAQAPPEL
jgi:1A family penicillin-binding protein